MLRSHSKESTRKSMKSTASTTHPQSIRSRTFSARQPSPESARRSTRLGASAARSQSLRPPMFTSRPPSPGPSRHSIRSKNSLSSTVHASSVSDKEPFISSSQMGEQIWEYTTPAPGGQRTENKIQRGVVTRAPEANQIHWKKIVQTIIGYQFRDADLLEEALESKDSGVTSVGESRRHFLDGNQGLARTGEAAMRLVLREQCYLFRIPEGDAKITIDQITGRTNLEKLGMNSKIQQFIRPRRPVRPTKRRHIGHLFMHDVKSVGNDPSRTIMYGIQAIIGAVYFDGGLDCTKRVMAQLGLIIKLPEPKRMLQAETKYMV